MKLMRDSLFDTSSLTFNGFSSDLFGTVNKQCALSTEEVTIILVSLLGTVLLKDLRKT